jgi:hypothetical protein
MPLDEGMKGNSNPLKLEVHLIKDRVEIRVDLSLCVLPRVVTVFDLFLWTTHYLIFMFAPCINDN